METSRQCAICSGGINQEYWTNSLHTVLVRDNNVEVGILQFNNDALLQESRSMVLSDQRTQIRLVPSPHFTPVEVFLIHRSCYLLLCKFTKSKISPCQVFKLCQAIQPDNERNFGFNEKISLANCPDPFASIRPQRCLSQSDTMLLVQPDTVKCHSLLQQCLPPEILQIILQYLSPSDLVQFFRTSKWALSYADLFCRLNPLYFYECNTNTTGVGEDKRILMIALSTWAHFPELDMRWEIVSKAEELAKLLPFVDENSFTAQTFNPRAPLQPVNCRLGLCEDFLDISHYVKTIEVCSIKLGGKHYVCGIGFNTGQSRVFIGHKTESLRAVTITKTTAKTIGLAIDALGVRNIKYGTSPWLFGDPKSICCWEGLSVGQGCRRIQIIHDALKLRYLSWHHETPPSFQETIFMRNKHPCLSNDGFISKEYYIQQHPEEERELVDKFGQIPVETVWFDHGLQTIKMYAGSSLDGISGLSMQTLSKTYSIGACNTAPTSITLHAPDEVLAEIDVRTSELYPLALTFRTNYNHELSSEEHGLSVPGIRHTIETLRPPPRSHMTGLYFRFKGTTIDSIGMVISLG